MTIRAGAYRFRPILEAWANVFTAVDAYPLMAAPKEPREEALKRFDERLDALAKSQARKPALGFGAEGGAGAAYRLIGELIGGVLGGLGLGWFVDRLAGTTPWGMIGGVLIGSGVSVFVIARSAGRMSKAAEPTAPAAPDAFDDEDDDGPGFSGRAK